MHGVRIGARETRHGTERRVARAGQVASDSIPFEAGIGRILELDYGRHTDRRRDRDEVVREPAPIDDVHEIDVRFEEECAQEPRRFDRSRALPVLWRWIRAHEPHESRCMLDPRFAHAARAGEDLRVDAVDRQRGGEFEGRADPGGIAAGSEEDSHDLPGPA